MDHITEPQAPARGRGGATIYETLREEIISLVLTPGTVLSRCVTH
jgi:DNA-binding GntR family transcriptional regulator